MGSLAAGVLQCEAALPDAVRAAMAEYDKKHNADMMALREECGATDGHTMQFTHTGPARQPVVLLQQVRKDRSEGTGMKTVDELMRLHDDAVGAQIAFLHAGCDPDAFDAMADEAAALGDVQDTRATLRSALEEVVANDRRYRWLRECGPTRSDRIATVSWPKMKNGVVTDVDRCLSREALDSAIDSAMQQAPEQEG